MTANLLREAQPPSMMAMTLIEPREKTISRPTLMLRATRVSPKGMTARHISGGRHHHERGQAEQKAVGARRHHDLLGEELDPTSATGWSQPP